ncbi:protein LNK3-like isoform X2 [Gastrolobium bilobum]|uniref:protein LNK3-like isoform X2 n=1 Tax=Gastrolobium bilobum TaxID=150636 RepID=UPI002AAF3974|nr:protein LNK3-like isoform X2 [Gastrolobium bilobum]
MLLMAIIHPQSFLLWIQVQQRDSVLEDFPSVEDLHKSFYYYPENHGSDSPGGFQKDISASKFVPCHSNSEDCMDIETVKVLDSFEQYSGDEAMHDQSFLEESTLQDLEMVIAQFTEKTRICFRDALYRLARNTKQQHDVVEDLDGDLNMQQSMPQAVHNETLRSEDNKPMESETNSVDRAVANLMFNKMESNILDLPLTTPVNFNQEVIGSKGHQGKSSKALNVTQKSHYPNPQELPGVALSDQQRATESDIAYADPIKKPFNLELG